MSLKWVESLGPRNIQVCTDGLNTEEHKPRGSRKEVGWDGGLGVLTRALGVGNKRGERRGQTTQMMVVLSL